MAKKPWCAEGVCSPAVPMHVKDCARRAAYTTKEAQPNEEVKIIAESSGWCVPSEVIKSEYDVILPAQDVVLPALTVPRGGLKPPFFIVETFVQKYRRGLFKRPEWRLHIRYYDGVRPMHHYMQFATEPLARNAEKIIEFTVQTVNEKYAKEKA